MSANCFVKSFTISSGTESEQINLINKSLVGIFIPAGIASTAFTIKNAVSPGDAGVTVYNGDGVYGAVSDYSPAIAASKYIPIRPSISAGLMNVTFVFNATETAKTFHVVYKDIA
jgi:hypothetical protein